MLSPPGFKTADAAAANVAAEPAEAFLRLVGRGNRAPACARAQKRAGA